jgi:drug/metabolite transporter (DMT)-like permease
MHKGMYTDAGEIIFTSNQVAALRMSIAGLALLPIALKHIKTLNRKTLIPLLICGFFGNFIPAFCFTYAEIGLDSSFVGMLNSAVPIFAIIIGLIVFKTNITARQIIGLGIGVIGVVGLVLSKEDVRLGGEGKYVLAAILATVCYAISLNTIKYKMEGLNAMKITSLSFFLTLIPSILITLYTCRDVSMNTETAAGFGYIVILAIIGTAVGVLMFSKLITISTALFASSVTYMIPIVATLWGIINHEKIGGFQVTFMVVLLLGVIIINTKAKKRIEIK